jgi:TP901 family phage tail tape measure protein
MYNYSMQLNLQSPSKQNINSVAKQIEAGLSGLNISISAKNLSRVNSQINSTTKALDKGAHAAKTFADNLKLKANSFAAYAAASTVILKIIDAFREATREAVRFDAELKKLAQITDSSNVYIREQAGALKDISIKYNIAINKVGALAGTLAQAGLSFGEAKKGADALAKTTLLSTFDSLSSTTEGFIAIMNTFNLTVTQTEKVLDSINSVSKAYAVESSDLIESIKRTGGAYKIAGGQINELLAQITAVRQTTRESAETIATGFRTIFARLQRPETIEYFKQLGIELETLDGKVVAPFEAVRRISEGLKRAGISAGDVKFAEVMEEIGGIRQLSKTVPLITQFRLQEEALQVANEGTVSTFEDLGKAQEGIGYKFGVLRQEFTSLVETMVSSKSISVLAETFIGIASSVIKFTEAISNLLPILTALAGIAATKGLFNFQKGGFKLPNIGGGSLFANTGGKVPGIGDGDTVPAMVTPGEFIINKRSAQKIGYGKLHGLNRYSDGGILGDKPGSPNISSDQFTTGIERSGGKLIETLDEFAAIMKAVGEEVGLDLTDIKTANETNRKYKGRYIPSTNEARAKVGKATAYTGVHEAAHAIDYRAGGKGYASKTVGTLQEKIVSLIREDVKNQLIASGASKTTMEERLKSVELFADFYTKSSAAVRKILASAVSAEEGMAQLAKVVAPGQTLFGNLQNHLPKVPESTPEPPVPAVDQAKLTKQISGYIRGMKKAETKLNDQNSRLGEINAQLASSTISEKEKIAITEERISIEKEMKKLEKSRANYLKKFTDASSKLDLSTGTPSGPNDPYGPFPLHGPPRPPNNEPYGPFPLQGPPRPVQEASNKLKTFTDFLSNATLATALFSQTIGSSLSQMGVKVNQGGISSGNNQALLANFASRSSEVIGKVAGEALSKYGKGLNEARGPNSGGNDLRSLGIGIRKLSGTLAKGLNAAGTIAAVGGLVDGLVSKDFQKEKESSIQRGDVEGAGESAAKAANQEFYRSIPIIGGFAAALSSVIPTVGDNVNALGRLAVANARLEASISGLSDRMRDADKMISIAQRDNSDLTGAFGFKLKEIEKVGENAKTSEKDSNRLKEFTGPSDLLRMAMFAGTLGFSERNTDNLQKEGFQKATAGFKEEGAAKVALANELSSIVQAKVGSTVRFGGTAKDAIAASREKIGAETFDKVFGDLSNLKDARKRATENVDKKNVDIKTLRESGKNLTGAAKERNELEIAKLETEKNSSIAILDLISTSEALEAIQIKLNKESKLRADAINQEIAALKNWQKYSDSIDKSAASLGLVANELDTIGTGTRSTNDFAKGIGLDAKVLSLDIGQILRDSNLADQLQKSLTQVGQGGQINRTRQALAKFDQIGQNGLADLLNDKSVEVLDKEGKKDVESSASVLSKKILQKIGGSGGDKVLENEVLNFSKTVLEDKNSVQEAVKRSQDNLIKEFEPQGKERQAQLKQLNEKTNELFKSEIELVNKRIKLAREQYSLQQSFSNELNSLDSDNASFFSQGNNRSDRQKELRSQSFFLDQKARATGVAGTNVAGVVGSLSGEIRGSANKEGAAFAAPAAAGELFADKIRDSISVEKERLDLMKQSATFQREYNQALRDAQGDLASDFASGTNQQRGDLLRTASATQIAATTGNFNSVPEEMRSQVFSFLDRFADIALPQFGGRTGAQVKGDISANELIRANIIDPSQAKDVSAKVAKETVPVDQRMAEQIRIQTDLIKNLMTEENKLRSALIDRESMFVDKFALAVDQFAMGLGTLTGQTLGAAPQIEVVGNQEITIRMPDIQGIVNTEVTKIVYSAVSDRFKQMSDKLVGVKNPEEIVSAFRDA